jgi:tricorn protease
MKRTRHVLFLGILCFINLIINASAVEKQLIGARYPAISPDGKYIAFSYMGDIWAVSSEGGKAVRLTDHMAYDREPIWSPDGKWLAFTSNRKGNNDVYLMNAEGGVPQQLTFHSDNDVANDFTSDGSWIIFTSSRSSSSSVLKISRNGGNAIPILDTYWSWPYRARIIPDGNTVLFSLGMENNFWWRRGYSGSNTAKIWIKKLTENTALLVFGDESNCFWPNWGGNGKLIYFVSDREYNNKNIWSVASDGSGLKAITTFDQEDVKWLTVAKSVPLASYEREFGIWITDLSTGSSRRVPIEAPAETKENRIFFVDDTQVSEFRLSPDGKKIAAVVRGDIFILSTDGGYARNITKTPWREKHIDWDKESKHIVYVSDTDANPDIYIISALGHDERKRLTKNEENVLYPRFSPDGKWIAYCQGKRQIRLMQPNGEADQLLIEDDFGGRFGDNFSWSPDSRYIAIVPQKNGNRDIFAVDIQTKNKILLTNTAYDESNPQWSSDGKFLLFTSNRFGHSFPEFTGKWDIYQVYLEPKKPEFEEDDFEKLFETKDKEEAEKPDKEKEEKPKKEEGENEKVEVKLRLKDLDRQTETVTYTLGNDRSYILNPKDNETIYFASNIDGEYHLWKTSLKKKERGKYESFMPQIRYPSDLQFDKKGQYLYYLSQGKLGQIDINSKKNKTIAFNVKIKVDKIADYEQALGELYYTLQHYFYDTDLHQVNWRKLYEHYKPVLQQVREDQDFYDYANEMIGHLNSSHTGIQGPRHMSTEEQSAHVGAEWDFSSEMVTLKRIIKNGPLYDQIGDVTIGDQLIAINGKIVEVKKNIWTQFNGLVGKRATLTFKSQKANKNVDISVEPISSSAEKRLLLEEWIESRKEIVKQKTDDEAAYIYMQAMGGGDLSRFLKELERDAVPRKGLILDLRFNFGGNVHDRVLQALTKPIYAKWRIRGLSETPQSTFGVSDKPIVLLVNEVTLSDGEMTANGYKTLKRGPIVGNTTYGWLIFTTGVRLMNGGYFRLPFWGCYTLDGQDLETSGGVKPDIFVINDLNHDLQRQDPQLDKAIEVILEKIKR